MRVTAMIFEYDTAHEECVREVNAATGYSKLQFVVGILILFGVPHLAISFMNSFDGSRTNIIGYNVS